MKFSTNILDRILDPNGRCLTPEGARLLVDLKIDPEVQALVDELAEKSNEGTLTEQERRDYRVYVDAAMAMSILKAKARRLLHRGGGPSPMES